MTMVVEMHHSGKVIFKLVDETGRVIRQTPPEELLRISRAIDAMLEKNHSGHLQDEA
jgi:uncharacterized FlaG/YvyC family protein